MRPFAMIGLCLTFAPAVAAQSPQRGPDFTAVRHLILEGLVNEKATAAAIAVVRDGAILWEEAFGWADSANGLRTTPHSAFQLASLNKTIEATVVDRPKMSPDELQRIGARIRQIGVGRVLYGSDAAVGPLTYPKVGWAAFRRLPLTEAEFGVVASNIAPYSRD